MSSKDYLITKVKIPEFPDKIQHSSSIFLSGSCFTEHIYQKLDRYKFDALSNPFGILYNPVSIARSIERIVHLEFIQQEELVLNNGIYHSMDHHGSFSSKNPEEVIQRANLSIQEAHDKLKSCGFAFISPGTSKIYRYNNTQAVVGNCHKIPASAFTYEHLSLSECEAAIEKIYASIKSLSPNCKIIWTVSPVRHLKDGLVENQQSKATLILSIMGQMKKHGDTQYFPAYEIMIDELRDYRYYNRDMTHPSSLAIDIIWNTFQQACIDSSAAEIIATIEKVKRAMDHRILTNDKDSTLSFAKAQLKIIDTLEKRFTNLNWEEEKRHFSKLIKEA